MTERKNGLDRVLLSGEEWEEYEDEDGEMPTPAPTMLEGSLPNRTGNLH